MHTLRCIGRITPLANRISSINGKQSVTYAVAWRIQQNLIVGGTRNFSSTPENENQVGNLASQLDMDSNKLETVFYEGPFSSLALRLKRVSLTSCFVATFGLVSDAMYLLMPALPL